MVAPAQVSADQEEEHGIIDDATVPALAWRSLNSWTHVGQLYQADRPPHAPSRTSRRVCDLLLTCLSYGLLILDHCRGTSLTTSCLGWNTLPVFAASATFMLAPAPPNCGSSTFPALSDYYIKPYDWISACAIEQGSSVRLSPTPIEQPRCQTLAY